MNYAAILTRMITRSMNRCRALKFACAFYRCFALSVLAMSMSVHAEFTVCPKPILQQLLKTTKDEVPMCKPVPKQVQWLVLQVEQKSSVQQISHVYLYSLDMQQRLELLDHQQLHHKALSQGRSSIAFANEFIDLGQKNLAIELTWTQQHTGLNSGLQRYSSFILVKPKYLHVVLGPIERDRQLIQHLDQIGSQRDQRIDGQWTLGRDKRMGLFDLYLNQTETIQDQLRNASGQTGTRQEEYRRVQRYRFDGVHYKRVS